MKLLYFTPSKACTPKNHWNEPKIKPKRNHWKPFWSSSKKRLMNWVIPSRPNRSRWKRELKVRWRSPSTKWAWWYPWINRASVTENSITRIVSNFISFISRSMSFKCNLSTKGCLNDVIICIRIFGPSKNINQYVRRPTVSACLATVTTRYLILQTIFVSTFYLVKLMWTRFFPQPHNEI